LPTGRWWTGNDLEMSEMLLVARVCTNKERSLLSLAKILICEQK
ncbi:hypothetical protein SAMN02745171_01704, partial [Porphyromonas circumdentaria]